MSGVEIYTGLFCSYCDRAKEILDRKGVAYTEIDVSTNVTKLRELARRSGGRMSVPQIFIGDSYIGGYKELAALERSGKLDTLIAGTPLAEPRREG